MAAALSVMALAVSACSGSGDTSPAPSPSPSGSASAAAAYASPTADFCAALLTASGLVRDTRSAWSVAAQRGGDGTPVSCSFGRKDRHHESYPPAYLPVTTLTVQVEVTDSATAQDHWQAVEEADHGSATRAEVSGWWTDGASYTVRSGAGTVTLTAQTYVVGGGALASVKLTAGTFPAGQADVQGDRAADLARRLLTAVPSVLGPAGPGASPTG